MEDIKETKPEVKKNGVNQYFMLACVVLALVIGAFALRAFFFSAPKYTVTMVDAKNEVPAGSIVTFTWRIDGPPATVSYTTVHLGTESNPGNLGENVKTTDTKYTDLVKDFINGTYNIPLQFVGNVKIDKPGRYYARAHVLVEDKNYWSGEYSFLVK